MFTRTLSIAVVAASLWAGSAQAQTSTEPPVVAPLPSGDLGGKRFGSKGTISITNEVGAELGYVNVSSHGFFVVNLLPGADYFAIDHLSVGGDVGFTFTSYDGGTGGNFILNPRIGYQIPITPALDIWPRGGMQLLVGDPVINGLTASGSETHFGFLIDAPIIYHVSPHFFLGMAPTFYAQLTGDTKISSFTFNFVMGGYISP
jgi:hypothetical protein